MFFNIPRLQNRCWRSASGPLATDIKEYNVLILFIFMFCNPQIVNIKGDLHLSITKCCTVNELELETPTIQYFCDLMSGAFVTFTFFNYKKTKI